MTPLPKLLCPLCGGPNDCAPALSGSFETPCWCRAETVAIDAQALARVPVAWRGKACLCAVCAGVKPPDPAVP